MKSAFIAVAAVFASTVIAQPHVRHLHLKHHLDARADPPMVIVTEYESTTTTVGVTTTIWVTEGEVPPTPEAKPAAQFFEPEKQPDAPVVTATPPAVIPPSPAATSITPATSAQPVAAAPVVPVPEVVAPVPAPAPEVPAPVAQPPAPAPEIPAPEPEVPAAPAPVPVVAAASVAAPVPSPDADPVAKPPSSGSSSAALLGQRGGSIVSGGQCTEGSPCSGKSTYYDTVGTGSCGQEVDGTSVPIIALPKAFMEQKEGPNPNNNPYCNKGVTISYNGKTVNAYVFDKCPGCAGMAIDLSHAAFKALAPNYLDIGHAEMQWWFN